MSKDRIVQETQARVILCTLRCLKDKVLHTNPIIIIIIIIFIIIIIIIDGKGQQFNG